MSTRRKFLQTLPLAILGSYWLAKGAAQPAVSGGADRPLLAQKIEHALYAFVVADAMGGSIENFVPADIFEKFENWDFNTFLPPTAKKDIETKLGKGDGRTTDDSINLEAVIEAYLGHQDHMDAYDYARHYTDYLAKQKIWIAEKGAEMTPNDRPLWWPERYVYQRLAINYAEPRQAGIGNYLNEGFQGNALPVGAINVGDPQRAYDEITAFGQAHTESYALECAGANAAAYAVAFQKQATVDDVIAAALSYAQDGTLAAIKAVQQVVNPTDDLRTFVSKTRAAVLPYLQLGPGYDISQNPLTPKTLREGTNMARPSRIAVVENTPIAFAALRYGQGSYMRTLKAALFYGRDGETIAAVATSLLAALQGSGVVPAQLCQQVDAVNKRNYAQLAQRLYDTVRIVHQKDTERLARRGAVL